MNKKYFDTPALRLVRLQEDVIATSNPTTHNGTGNASQPGGGVLIPDRRRSSIWD